MDNELDNRRFERSQFFLVQKDRDFLPIWVFKPEHNPTGIAGVLVDVSAGGLQILIQQNAMSVGQRFEMSLINQIGDDAMRLPPGQIKLVWSHDLGTAYTKCGFVFHSYTSDQISSLMTHTLDGENKFMRCILKPYQPTDLM